MYVILKLSNADAKNVTHFKLCHQRDKMSNYNYIIISDKQNLANKAFYMGFMFLKIKIKENQTGNKTRQDKHLKSILYKLCRNFSRGGGALPYKPIPDVSFFRVSFLSINS